MARDKSLEENVRPVKGNSVKADVVVPVPALHRLAALDASGMGTWSWNIVTNKVSWDSRCKSLFGCYDDGSAATTYETFMSYIYPEDLAYTQEALNQVIHGHGSYDVIHRVVWADGTVHWVRCVGNLTTQSGNKEVAGVTIDLSWFKQESEERHRNETLLRRSNEELVGRVKQQSLQIRESSMTLMMQAQLLDLAHDAIFVCGLNQRVTYWNLGAERLYGWSSAEAMGQVVHELLHTEFPLPVAEILRLDHWEGELQHTKRDGSKISVASRWTTLRDEQSQLIAWLQINSDITARKRAEQAAGQLSSRILKLQDEERRKIARELHDSLGQIMTSLKINLDVMQAEAGGSNQCDQRIPECIRMVEQALDETRTLSHLLHPPLLDEAGFASAARWYVEGFAKRSGLQVDIDIPDNLPRLRSNLELCLFRILQECLTNVHRHAACTGVKVTLQSTEDALTLSVVDNGKGISADRLRELRLTRAGLGIGLAGMRERLAELGGELLFDSDRSGTMVTAIIPIVAAPELATVSLQRPSQRSA